MIGNFLTPATTVEIWRQQLVRDVRPVEMAYPDDAVCEILRSLGREC